MKTRVLASLAVLFLSTACVGAAPNAPAAAPPPPAELSAPPAVQAPTGPVASGVTVGEAAPAPAAPADDEVVVRSTRESQVPPPEGDPRSSSERMRDIRAWDQCVTRAQAAGETDPTRPVLDTPEELCARSLGMASRMAVPDSRRR